MPTLCITKQTTSKQCMNNSTLVSLTAALDAVLRFAEQYPARCSPYTQQAQRSDDLTLSKSRAAAEAVIAIARQLESIGQLSEAGIHTALASVSKSLSVTGSVADGYRVVLAVSPLMHRTTVWTWLENLAGVLEEQLNAHLPESDQCCISELYIYEWAGGHMLKA